MVQRCHWEVANKNMGLPEWFVMELLWDVSNSKVTLGARAPGNQ